MDLPKRTSDTMADAISMSSPNGRVSKSAKQRALKALSAKLFGPEGLQPEAIKEDPSLALYRAAARLRQLAASGMSPRKHLREAEKLEALADNQA
jgi:hypothetical protein